MTAASIRQHPEDSVAIALQDIEMGTIQPDHGLKLVTAVKLGHKFALADLAVGAHVLTHNLGMGEHTQEYAMAQANSPLGILDHTRTFDGYHRVDGKVGDPQLFGGADDGELFGHRDQAGGRSGHARSVVPRPSKH